MRFSATAVVSCALVSLASAASFGLKGVKAPYCPPRPASRHEKRLIFQEFVTKFFVNYNASGAVLEHMAEDYIQHNPTVVSGRDAAAEALSFLSPETVKFTVRLSGIDGDVAYVYSRLDIVGLPEPLAVADFLRFNGSCIQEHWDTAQAMPANRTNPLEMW
ncbi:hypothetical protein ACHAQA_004381 [Verticillium albo-atrum]